MDRYELYRRQVSRLADADKFSNAKFLVLVGDTISYMGADYGPPDPPPSMETENVIRTVFLDTEEDVAVWIENHTNTLRYITPKPYRVFRISPVAITTEVKIKVGR